MKIRLFPSKELHRVWKRWLAAYRYYFNQCISYLHHKLGGHKIFKCPHCGIQVYRDVNGARNILLRALQATAFTVTHDSIVLSEESELTDAVVNLV
ncbi:zinc ribbon domain-containing protein [Anabaenopsis elenkinii]|uniref:zinc ribbon domain-containing protein n=1 Tax=Anabaenopsis elenkinii TaxID=156213 RepID=UPI001CED14C6|nr:zinc ribbon domain-containing protein [Anabaenopsis elenkinii]